MRRPRFRARKPPQRKQRAPEISVDEPPTPAQRNRQPLTRKFRRHLLEQQSRITRSNHHPSRKRRIVPCARASVVINRSAHDVGQQRRPRILPRRKREPHAHTLWSANRPLVATSSMHRHVKRTTHSEKSLLSSGKRCSTLKQHLHRARRQRRRKLSQRAAKFHQLQLFQARIIRRSQAQHLHLGSPHTRKHTFTSISNGSLERRQPRRLGNAGGRHAVKPASATLLAVAQHAQQRLALQTRGNSPAIAVQLPQIGNPRFKRRHRHAEQRIAPCGSGFSIRHRLTHGRQQHHIICIHSIHAHHSIAHPIAHLYHAKDSQQLFRPIPLLATKKAGRPNGRPALASISLPRASESYSPSYMAFRRSKCA